MNGTNSKEIELVGFGLNARSAGLNLCHENAEEFAMTMPSVDFVQVHPEHFLQDLGGNYVHAFEKLKENYPLTFHGFGLSTFMVLVYLLSWFWFIYRFDRTFARKLSKIG
ncbi:DUF692 family protein [Cyanobacterium aponinum UTEX 3222]|uniref:multinuclear nonheme iron-dependent oxidase n=1 Tax=Cyanobacterium aponinum TaxID=379064 RepID=UPI0030937BC2|nr:DUF692 family protein [Cyanobacterium aponinum UTEX 3222]